MAEEKTPVPGVPAVEEKIAKGPKTYTYVGPKPAPLISNLPTEIKNRSLGTRAEKIPADELFERLGAAYVEYVMKTNTAAVGFWK